MTLEDGSLNGNVDNENSLKNCFRLVILGKFNRLKIVNE